MALHPQPTVPPAGRSRGRWRAARLVVAAYLVLKVLAVAGLFGYVALTHSIEQALPVLALPALGAVCLVVCVVLWRRRVAARSRAHDVAAQAQESPPDPRVEDDLAA
jgi:threonine/homoserine/homoserine lactone efflux protein